MNNTLCKKASLLARKLNCCMPKLQSEVGESVSDSTGGHGCSATIPKNSGSDIGGLMLASGVPEGIGLYESYLICEIPDRNLRVYFTRTQEHYGILCGSKIGKRVALIPLCGVFFDQGRLYMKDDPARQGSRL